MPAEEAARLLAEFTECHRLSRAAWSALTYPVRSLLPDGYRTLVETDAAARVECNRARAALQAYHHVRTDVHIFLTEANPPIHIVYPCADENRITEAAGAFAVSGLRKRGDAVVLVTTDLRRQTIERHLTDEGFNIQAIESNGQLAFLDAATLLSAFMADGIPDAQIFKNHVEQIIHKAGLNSDNGQPRKVRIFGDMVNLLYMASNISAATRLEEFWDEIVAAHCISLFCAYSLKLDSDRLPQPLLDAHSHDLSSRSQFRPVGPFCLLATGPQGFRLELARAATD
jgi:MEDS: MEthanogen/methylotroph, DcmR Sensory domain